LVEDVQAPREDGADTVVSMACMEDQAIGQRLTVFLEREIDFELLGESSWDVVAQRGFDQPGQFSAYLNTLRWNCVTATDAELFQAPYRAGIDVKASGTAAAGGKGRSRPAKAADSADTEQIGLAL
jgi:hypothetical protein